jgi:DNA (cytosine-5)-methyltransferase 1
MPRSEDIINKRETLGLTRKEFSDALRFGRNGESRLRSYENGEINIPDTDYESIMNFAVIRPFAEVNPAPHFTFIDLFAGIGGIRIPFQEIGGQCVFSSEWDKHAQTTYRINFGETPAGDITKIATEDIPDFNILLGGFPCQPFSQAGRHLGFQDTRGTLFFEIERIIQEKKLAGFAPHAFLLENVKQLKGHDGGNTFNVIMNHLDNLGYYAKARVLRAGDFGVPQNRERIYIVGFDRDYYNIPDDYDFEFPEPNHIPTRVGDILENNVDEKYTISDRLWAGHLRRKDEHQRKGNGFGYSLFNSDSPYVNTISARYYKDGSEVMIDQGQGRNPRKLTPRECARLQGYPEEFIIPVSDCQAYKQFGNSVAVPVIRAIAQRIIEEMNNLPLL